MTARVLLPLKAAVAGRRNRRGPRRCICWVVLVELWQVGLATVARLAVMVVMAPGEARALARAVLAVAQALAAGFARVLSLRMMAMAAKFMAEAVAGL